MVNSVVHDLLSDPGVRDAKALVENLKAKGFIVFANPASGITVHSVNTNILPLRVDMDAVYSMHHEIGLLFSIQTLGKHFQSLAKAGRVIEEIRQESRKS